MNKTAFFNAIRPMFPGKKLTAAQVAGMEAMMVAFDMVGDKDQDTLAYGLATVFHETGCKMQPVREGNVKTDASARKAVKRLAEKRGPNSAVARYAQAVGPYGHWYYGRGLPQLTFLENYKASSADAGVDLVKNPDAMLDPVISARVLFRGLMDGRWNGKGKGISFYEGDDDFLSDAEAIAARRTINVQDKASLIAGYHRKFYNALTKAGWSSMVRPDVPPRAGRGLGPPPQESFWAALMKALAQLFGK